MKAKWIWLNSKEYPDYQISRFMRDDEKNDKFAVAEFNNNYSYDKKIVSAEIKVSASIKYLLWINDKYIGRGPIDNGGDIDLQINMPAQYYNTYSIAINSNRFDIFSAVYNKATVYSDYGIGHGGFFFEAELTFDDNSKETIISDESWKARLNSKYIDANNFDAEKNISAYSNASEFDLPSIRFSASPLPNLIEKNIDFSVKKYNKNETVFEINFDKIYCGFLSFDAHTNERIKLDIKYIEVEIEDIAQTVIINGNASYRSLIMKSCDKIIIKSDKDFDIKNIAFSLTHYPCDENNSYFNCSDSGLNKVYDVCKYTLMLCRQTMHLDSPMHQEPLGCTGDYYIESLMNYYSYGDNRLTRLDLVRTADRLITGNGYMFHTTYSMLFIQMLYDYYMYSGDKTIFDETMPALDMLLEKFDSYIGENGLIEKCPNYMFMDWMVCDGYSLHHPPKALGQTVLCAFYYGGLKTAEKIYEICEKSERKNQINLRAESLKKSINKYLFDKEKGIYFSGLNTPHFAKSYQYLPDNPQKKYFTKHSNILCALYGVCDNEKEIIEKVIEDETLTDYQPYFAHFVLDAVYKAGLFEKYGMKILRKWIPIVNDCDKGLAEGWHKPEESYRFDHSHAWGGTPLYQLPNKLTGLKILEPGMKKISLSPNSYGLEYFETFFTTPYGKIHIKYRDNNIIFLDYPKNIFIIL